MITSRQPTVRAIIPVWGDSFIDQFVNYGLPSQLAAGNLPALSPLGLQYDIYCRSNEVYKIKRSAAHKALSQIANVTFHVIVPSLFATVYKAMTHAYMECVARYSLEYEAFLFLTPDSVWSENTFSTIVEQLSFGKRALFLAGVRGHKQLMCAELANAKVTNDAALALRGAELVRMLLRNLHPFTRDLFSVRDSGQYSRWPSHVYLGDVGAELFICNGFHLHPLFIWPHRPITELTETIDTELINAAGIRFEEIYIYSHSRDGVGIDLTDGERESWSGNLPRLNQDEFLSWVIKNTTPIQRRFFEQTIVFDGRDGNPPLPDQLVAAGRKLVDLVRGQFSTEMFY